MATIHSYDLNGKELSFANWISNISPEETPFTSMTKKVPTDQITFQWQTDNLDRVEDNAVLEGSSAVEDDAYVTLDQSNVTQILRKVIKVSDTSNSLSNYGRGKELEYQMTKAGTELMRDIEWAFLNNKAGAHDESSLDSAGASVEEGVRLTAGFYPLVAPANTPCPETGAVVNFFTKDTTMADHSPNFSPDIWENEDLTESKLWTMTYNLYLSGSDANTIMYHPSQAKFFSSLQESPNVTYAGARPETPTLSKRTRLFENTDKVSLFVNEVTDPLGQTYMLIPNRWMPTHLIYFFDPSDWTQRVLRQPKRTQLSKKGSSEKWMIEAEVGLQHANPYGSGVLWIGSDAVIKSKPLTPSEKPIFKVKKISQSVLHSGDFNKDSEFNLIPGKPLKLKVQSKKNSELPANIVVASFKLIKDGQIIMNHKLTSVDGAASEEFIISEKASPSDAGTYVLVGSSADGALVELTDGMHLRYKS